jgi:nucleotide-binding universal stress UspA family protein
MFDRIRILVGYDDSLQSKKALAEAITISKCFSGFIKVVNVYEKDKKKEAEAIIFMATQDLEKEDVAYEGSLVLGSNPAKALETIAKQENFDLIVVGSRGLGGKMSMLVGSVSKQVVGSAYCNVLVVKKQSAIAYSYKVQGKIPSNGN